MTPEEKAKRLDRLQKRERGDNIGHDDYADPLIASRKRTRTDPVDVKSGHSPSENVKTEQLLPEKVKTEIIEIESDEEVPSKTKIGPRYIAGEVLLTAVTGYKVQPHHVTFNDLVQKSDLTIGVFSAFQIDPDWLQSKLLTSSMRTYVVCQCKDREMRGDLDELWWHLPNVELVFPDMSKASSMHSKLQLLFFEDYMRIVVTSANLTGYDWGESGTMENVIFVQDYPKAQAPSDSELLRELVCYCQCADYPSEIITKLSGYDFTLAFNFQIVASIGGASIGDDIEGSGIARLAAVARLYPGISRMDYVTASLGALNHQFLKTFQNACKGITISYGGPLCYTEQDENELRIIFPTKQFVHSSKGGPANGGTICFQRDYFERPGFPSTRLYEHVPVRPGLLSHCKILLCYNENTNDGFAYIGSANFSASAWGDKLVPHYKKHKLVVRNWEFGIVVPIAMIRDRLPVRLENIQQNTSPWFFMW